MFNTYGFWEQMSIMDSVSRAGNSPFANLKKTTGTSSKLKLEFKELNQQAIQVAFGLKKDQPDTLLKALKAICVDAGAPFTDLSTTHQSTPDLLNAIGQAVHQAQTSKTFNDTHRQVAQNMYSLLKAARKFFGGKHEVFTGFKRDQRGEYQTEKTQTGVTTTVYKDERRIKSSDKTNQKFNQTAWTSYFKDALAFQETVDAPKTSDLEVLGKKVTPKESQKILFRLGVRAKGQQVSLDQVNDHWKSPVKNTGTPLQVAETVRLAGVVSILPNRGLPGYGGWDDAGRQSCTRKLREYFSKNRGTGINQLRPTSRLPYKKDLKSLQQSVQVHIRPDSTMKPNDVGRWLKQKQYYDPILDSQIKENAMDVVLTGSMKQFYDYDENTPAASRDLTKNPRDFEFMYNVMPNFQKQNRHLNRPEGAHYNQVFENSGHLKSGYEGTMKTLFKRSFTTMMYACTKHYEATKRNGFTSFEFPVQMPNAFFDGFDDERVEIDGISYNGKDIAKRIFAKALHEFLVETTLPEGCSGVTTIGFGGHSSHLNHANVRHSNANSLHYYDAAKKANVQCLVPIMGDEHSRMMNGAFDNGAEQAAEENISRQTLGQPAMLLCPVNNPNLAANLN